MLIVILLLLWTSWNFYLLLIICMWILLKKTLFSWFHNILLWYGYYEIMKWCKNDSCYTWKCPICFSTYFIYEQSEYFPALTYTLVVQAVVYVHSASLYIYKQYARTVWNKCLGKVVVVDRACNNVCDIIRRTRYATSAERRSLNFIHESMGTTYTHTYTPPTNRLRVHIFTTKSDNSFAAKETFLGVIW